jgi:adenylyltransferase/sulfurtransferase
VTRLIDYDQFCGIAPAAKEENPVKNGIPQIAVTDLKKRLDAGEDLFVLDVREPFEYQIANIGGTLIPMGQVPQRLDEIDRNREIVVQCKSGGRSQRIAEFLKQAGYEKVANLAGGILAWSDQVDPSVPKY